MIDNPFETFAESLDFLNIKFTEEKLKIAIKNSDFQTLKNQEKVEGFVEKPIKASSFFRKGRKNDWVNHIKKEDADAFLLENNEIFKSFYR